jgi:hypothetical protein
VGARRTRRKAPKPDAELFDVKTAPARRQKMPELMHDNEQIEKNKDLEEDQKNASDVKNHESWLMISEQ